MKIEYSFRPFADEMIDAQRETLKLLTCPNEKEQLLQIIADAEEMRDLHFPKKESDERG